MYCSVAVHRDFDSMFNPLWNDVNSFFIACTLHGYPFAVREKRGKREIYDQDCCTYFIIDELLLRSTTQNITILNLTKLFRNMV